MKKKSYIKFVNVLSYPTKMVWREEYRYERNWLLWNPQQETFAEWMKNRLVVVPAHWVRLKDFDNPYQEKGKYYVTTKWRHYRKPHTIAERRASFDHPEFVRAKRNATNLPDSWDDIPIFHNKSWKDTHKCRKQWMKNL